MGNPSRKNQHRSSASQILSEVDSNSFSSLNVDVGESGRSARRKRNEINKSGSKKNKKQRVLEEDNEEDGGEDVMGVFCFILAFSHGCCNCHLFYRSECEVWR